MSLVEVIIWYQKDKAKEQSVMDEITWTRLIFDPCCVIACAEKGQTDIMLIIHYSIQLLGEVPRRNRNTSVAQYIWIYMFIITCVRKKTSPDFIFGGQKATRQGATFLDKHVGKLWELFISEH